MTSLLPPGAPLELEEMARNGQCPFSKDRHRTGPCGKPSKPGAPGAVCADHEPAVRAEIAEQLRYTESQLPRLEKEARQAQGRKDRAAERLEQARAELDWYRENAS